MNCEETKQEMNTIPRKPRTNLDSEKECGDFSG